MIRWPWQAKASSPVAVDTKAASVQAPANAQPVPAKARWPWLIREPFSGAWQQNREIAAPTLTQNSTVFACITLIAQDLSKLRAQLRQRTATDTWRVTRNPAYEPVLRKPNQFQSAMEFRAEWALSLLMTGNAYLLRQFDVRHVVNGLFVIDPDTVQPLVTPNGDVYFRLRANRFTPLTADAWPEALDDGSFVVSGEQMVHTKINTLFSPVVGISPLWACALPALNGLSIANNAQNFWSNAARPSGILTAPGPIADETAKRLADYWNENFSGKNAGRIAVLGDNLKFEKMTLTSAEAQLIDQLKWSAETICSVFHVPAFKVGVGTMPTYQNGEVLNSIYLSDCLGYYVELFETAMDEALNLSSDFGVTLDLSQLLRTDMATRYKAHSEGIAGGWLTPNEAREQEDLPPIAGGNEAALQQQQWPVRELARRTAPPA